MLVHVDAYDWDTALHEAAHAEVGIRLGRTLVSMTLAPPMTRLASGSQASASRRRPMAIFAAGNLAEQIHNGRPTADAFEASLTMFFDQVGDFDIASVRARSIAAGAAEDDVYDLACLIDSYSTRSRGWAQFRHARSAAVRILTEHWGAVQERARRALDP